MGLALWQILSLLIQGALRGYACASGLLQVMVCCGRAVDKGKGEIDQERKDFKASVMNIEDQAKRPRIKRNEQYGITGSIEKQLNRVCFL